ELLNHVGVPLNIHDINDAGDVLSDYYGSILIRKGDGTFLLREVSNIPYATPMGFNNRGDVVGCFGTADGRSHGFALNLIENIPRIIDVGWRTCPTDINDLGEIVGTTAATPDDVIGESFVIFPGGAR